MLRFRFALIMALGLAAGRPELHAQAPTTLELRPGDHIAIVGNALADRFQHDGYFESFVLAKFPKHDLVFRNLAVAGDEVVTRHRSENFGSPDDWLKRVQADVVLAFFGYNESFRGPDGVEAFKRDLDSYLKHLAGSNYSGKGAPRIVLFSPTADERHKDPNFPDPAPNNANLRVYVAAMREVAKANQALFVDLFDPSLALYKTAAAQGRSLTVNGHYLTEEGDRRLAMVLIRGLFGAQATDWNLEKLRAAVNEKNAQWHARYRTIDGYNVYGGRSQLVFNGVSNYKVMQEEMAVRDVMTANRDKKVWAAAKGKEAEIDDSNLPPVEKVATNKRGDKADGSFSFLSGEEAISKMTLHSHFKINLYASEEQFPELANPVQMGWDTRGRLWVAAWPNYPERAPDSVKGDSLLVFEDVDGDGKADKVTHFVDDLNGPTGFQFYKDGVLLVQAPDIWYLRDTDGDGKADYKERVLMGLDSADSHHTANAIAIDPGGAVYLSDGVFHRTQVETMDGAIRNDDAAIHRFEPRTGKFEVYIPYGFANPHGKVFDYWGEDLITDATGNNTYFGPAFSGHLDYPRKHAGMREFWDRPSRPCPGTGIISSRHFPEEFQGNFLNLNVISFQGIYRVKVTEDGSGLHGETLENIVSSTDPNFRPSAISVGPDGALYFLDWHKPLIGHMQHHMRDPNRDKTHGRIYRLTYDGRPLLKPAKIFGQPIEALLDLLKEPENDVRTRAKIELGSRDSAKVMAALKKWVERLNPADSAYQHHLTEALWVCQWHNVVNLELLRRQLTAPDPHSRFAATRVLCYWRDRVPDALGLLKTEANDSSPRVRLEAVRAASFFRSTEAVEVALTVLKQPLDYYLEYTLNETLRQLEPVWKRAIQDGVPLATGNPEGLARLLRDYSANDLLKMRDNPAALQAVFRRPEATDANRAAALDRLAARNKTDRLTELFANLSSLEKSAHPAADTLAGLLPTFGPEPLKAQRGALVALTAADAHSPRIRQTAWAAIALADGGFDDAWPAAKSASAVKDLLEGIPAIPDADFRAKASDLVRPLLAVGPVADASIRRAAIAAAVSMGRDPTAVFKALAALIQNGDQPAAAAQGIMAIPRATWPAPEAGAAAQGILTWVQTVPDRLRSTPDVIAAVQAASDLAGLLPPDQAASVRQRLRSLSVSTFVIRTVREQMRYDTPRLVVEPGKPVKIIFQNNDFMPHNLVVVKPGAREAIGTKTATMRPDQTDDQGRPYVPKTPNVVAATHLVDGGKEETLEFTAPNTEGAFEYVCTYPGHWTLMWGSLVVTRDVDAYLAAHPVAAAAGEGGAHHHSAGE